QEKRLKQLRKYQPVNSLRLNKNLIKLPRIHKLLVEESLLKNKDSQPVIISLTAIALGANLLGAIFSGAGFLTVIVAAAVCVAGGWLIHYCVWVHKAMLIQAETLTAGLEQKHEQDRKTQIEIEELRLANQLSQRQKKSIEAIIHSISDAVVVTDEYDNIVLANQKAAELFDFEYETSAGKSIDEIFSRNLDLIELFRGSRKSRIHHKKKQLEISAGRLNAGLKTYDCIISGVYDKGDIPTGIVAVFHDVTREKQISQMKNEFISHVSHELKTPLASITAYSEMLVDGEADDEQTRVEFYSVIQSQAKRLNALIEDILNVSRIESGLVKVDKQPVSITLLIKEQMQMIKNYAKEKNIEVIGQIPIVFDQVYADKNMISQVIINLLSNAVKYTQNGGKVSIQSGVDESDGVVRVSISDTGVGIDQEELPRVFDKFYRVKKNEKYAKGTGLGLNLVKQIVEKVHGGKVFVTSEVGVGSTFWFELPLASADCLQIA
ncbi:MAG: ATP-binding protein, partial [Phycisphaerae bacterium]|nr:ATP-binding protein [Phycisphaerae bacterium]